MEIRIAKKSSLIGFLIYIKAKTLNKKQINPAISSPWDKTGKLISILIFNPKPEARFPFLFELLLH